MSREVLRMLVQSGHSRLESIDWFDGHAKFLLSVPPASRQGFCQTEDFISDEADLTELVREVSSVGLDLIDAGYPGQGAACLDAFVSVFPQAVDFHLEAAIAYFRDGKFEEAKPLLLRWIEKRLEMQGIPTPVWRGEDLTDKVLLVTADDGVGDTIEFVRCLRHLPPCKKALFALQPSFWKIIGALPGIEFTDNFHHPADFTCSLFALPHILKLDPARMGEHVPYLQTDPSRVAFWRKRLPADKFTIGIAWQTHKTGTILRGHGRSVPLKAFAPLARIPGVQLVSLQMRFGLEQLDSLPEGMSVQTLGPEFNASGDKAVDDVAVMSSLDLIVTCDTSVGHIAGAAGLPVWVILGKFPDWRWVYGRDTSPWYPTMRLFRQTIIGEWGDVMEQVATELRPLVAARKRSEELMVEVSAGELFDKISILEIKREFISDPEKLRNVERELASLSRVKQQRFEPSDQMDHLQAELKKINLGIWKTEDGIRDKERQKAFDAEFIELARSVYHQNDHRAKLKRDINLLCQSQIVEEKSYSAYQ